MWSKTLPGDVVIVGAGASGILVAVHLLRAGFGGCVTLVEKAPRVGEGVAYATHRPEHLLNVTAGRMSAFEADPAHFVRYLGSRGGEDRDLHAVFARRDEYAEYLRATLAEASAGAGNVKIVHDEARSIREGGRIALTLRSDRTLYADAIVLALGNWPRSALPEVLADVPLQRVVRGWEYEAVAAIRAEERVCVVGSGLSMVDAVLTLAAQRHAGPIHVVSRHGLMPLPHAAHGQVDMDIGRFVRLDLRARVAFLRKLAAEIARRGEPWQWLMDTLRPHNAEFWQSLTEPDRRRFLRHVVRYWDVHRHRIPIAAARIVDALKTSGQLRHRRGRLTAVAWRDGELEVRTEHRGAAGALQVNRLIDCTGLQTNIRRVPDPLVTSMIDSGIIRSGAHDLGIDADRAGAVIGHDGLVDSRLYTIGSARIGALWESVAVPELRRQAATLAQRLVETIG